MLQVSPVPIEMVSAEPNWSTGFVVHYDVIILIRSSYKERPGTAMRASYLQGRLVDFQTCRGKVQDAQWNAENAI